jgi:hypothetical protein
MLGRAVRYCLALAASWKFTSRPTRRVAGASGRRGSSTGGRCVRRCEEPAATLRETRETRDSTLKYDCMKCSMEARRAPVRCFASRASGRCGPELGFECTVPTCPDLPRLARLALSVLSRLAPTCPDLPGEINRIGDNTPSK